MSAFPTQFNVPFSSSSSSSSAKLPAPADAYIPWTPAPAPIDLHLAAHAKARQTKFVESTAQRRQRVEFLRRREWTRRIAEWIDSAAAGNSAADAPQAKVRVSPALPHATLHIRADMPTITAQALAPITYSWVDILAAADADDDYEDAPLPSPSHSPSPAPSAPAPCSSSPAPSPYPAYAYPYPYIPDEPDDDEPYVIYTASPRSSTSAGPLPPAYPARPPALSWQPAPSPAPTLAARRRSGPSPRSRHSSLSSISEEEEPVSAPCF